MTLANGLHGQLTAIEKAAATLLGVKKEYGVCGQLSDAIWGGAVILDTILENEELR
jgi:hypothetical protein